MDPEEIRPNSSDQALINACLAGNELAWGYLINRYSRLIYAIPLRFGLSEMLADEVFQDVCVTLLNKIDTLHSVDRLSAWITTVTRRTSINLLRQIKPEVAIEDIELGDGAQPIEGDIVQLEQAALIYEALPLISDRCQHLIRVLFLQPKAPSYETLAADLGISTGSIGPTRIRCLKKLKQTILELG